MGPNPDFSGWATKANVKCSDGRTIIPDAFKHMDGKQVPLVWQHGHSEATNVLGHAILTNKPEGVRADAFFNATPAGQNAKLLVEHEDIKHLSIYANQLVEKGNKNVVHGNIREVSLVLAGANPGALIDFVNIKHSDGSIDELDDEAIIHTGLELELKHEADANAAPAEPTVQDIYDSMTDEQKTVVNYIVESAVEAAKDPDGDGDDDAKKGVEDDKKDAAHSDKKTDTKPGEGDLSHKEGTNVTRNVFDQTDNKDTGTVLKHALSRADAKAFLETAKKLGTLQAALDDYVLQHSEVADHALAHGIEPIDVLFPNFTNLTNTPQFLSRRMEWVQGVLDSTSKTPFSSVRTIIADITQEEARALGYIKGSFKKEEWFTVTKRTTTASTVYKKQKLDRDDLLDITDFDVVAWMKGEMSLMLKEEVARAILIGDGRDIADPDKVQDPMAATNGAGIRSIINEHELFKTDVNININDANSSYLEVVEGIVQARRWYKGSGTPTFYTTWATLTSMLLTKDTLNRRLYQNKADLAAAMMVDDIIPVEVMETIPNLLGVVVNLSDYNIGANKGGEVTLFDFFDIDYNQYKYLGETRVSGALVRPKSALAVWSTAGANVLATPTSPTWVKATGVVTVPTVTGVVYKNQTTGATLTAGAQAALTAGQEIFIVAVPAAGYYFSVSTGLAVEWHYEVGGTNSTS